MLKTSRFLLIGAFLLLAGAASFASSVGRIGSVVGTADGGTAVIGKGLYVASAPNLLLATTDASATPTTTQLTIPGWANGFRVWTNETPVTEESFSLYVRKNGGTTRTAKSYRFQGRAFVASPGDTVALGTSDGRQVYIAPCSAPNSLVAPSSVSGTANADAAGPPIWAPSSVHVQLAQYNQTINLAASDSTERVIFISESPDGSTWTPPRWAWLPASGSINVLCTFKNVALANYAGVAITVNAPSGATIGGTSNPMALGFPAITGASRSATNAATLATAMAAAVSGDEIVLSPGTYTMTSTINANTFAANNNVNGNKGCSGITFRSSTGVASDVLIQMSGNVNFNVDNANASTIACFKNLTFDCTACTSVTSVCQFHNGRWKFQNVIWTGPSSAADNMAFFADSVSTSVGCIADLLLCQSNTSFADCYSTGGSGAGAGQNAASLIRMINCSASTSGTNSNDQLITAHTGLGLSVYGGVYTDANQNAFSAYPGIYMFFVTGRPGTRQAGVYGINGLFACDLSLGTGASPAAFSIAAAINDVNYTMATAYANFNKVSIPSMGASQTLLRSSVGVNFQQLGTIAHNRFTSVSATGNCWKSTVGGSADFNWNICSGFATAAVSTTGYTSGSTANQNIVGNTFVNGPVTSSDANLPLVLLNNAFLPNTGTQITGGTATTTGNYNTFKTKSAYTLGANDTSGAAAAIDATSYLPTASGNCDANGDTADVTWIGDSDPYGMVLIFSPGTVSRGARAIQVNGAGLYPDIWQ